MRDRGPSRAGRFLPLSCHVHPPQNPQSFIRHTHVSYDATLRLALFDIQLTQPSVHLPHLGIRRALPLAPNTIFFIFPSLLQSHNTTLTSLLTTTNHSSSLSSTCPELSRSAVLSPRSVPDTTSTRLAETPRPLRRGSKVRSLSYSFNDKPMLNTFATSRRSQGPARRKERRLQQRH